MVRGAGTPDPSARVDDHPGGGMVQPTQAGWRGKYAGIDGESVGGLVGSSTGGRGGWLKSKSATRLPRIDRASRTSGRRAGRWSGRGASPGPEREAASMEFREAAQPGPWGAMDPPPAAGGEGVP